MAKKTVIDELIDLSEAEHKFVDSAKYYSHSHKGLLIFFSSLIIILILIIVLFVVRVPTVVQNETLETRPIVVPQVETRKMEFLSLVPYQEEQLKEVTIDNREEASVLIDVCSPVDFDFDYSYATDFETDEWDKKNKVGYKDGKYVQAVDICNHEDKKLQLTFNLCLWLDDEKLDCRGEFPYEVLPNTCSRATDLVWETEYDYRKSLFVEFKRISQKETCRKDVRTVLVGKRPRKDIITVNVTRYSPQIEYRNVLVDTNKVVYEDYKSTKQDVIYVSLWQKMFG